MNADPLALYSARKGQDLLDYFGASDSTGFNGFH
jgi:hypothetical protein